MDRPTKEQVNAVAQRHEDGFQVNYEQQGWLVAEVRALREELGELEETLKRSRQEWAEIMEREQGAIRLENAKLREELALARAKNPPWYNDVTALVKAAREVVAEGDAFSGAQYDVSADIAYVDNDALKRLRDAVEPFDD